MLKFLDRTDISYVNSDLTNKVRSNRNYTTDKIVSSLTDIRYKRVRYNEGSLYMDCTLYISSGVYVLASRGPIVKLYDFFFYFFLTKT